MLGPYLEVASVEGGVGVNDHEGEAPLVDVHVIRLEES